MRRLPIELAAQVSAVANRHGLEPALVAAIVWQESGGVHWKLRFEPGWKYFTKLDGSPCKREEVRGAEDCSDETERILQACGLGLMQVQGSVARERGFTGAWLSRLLDEADMSLEYGCRQLAWLRKRASLEDAVAAYNGGLGVLSKPGLSAHVAAYQRNALAFYREFQRGGLA